MPDDRDDDLEQDDGKPHDPSVQLRLAQKRLKEQEQAMAALQEQAQAGLAAQRTAAFLRAGIDPEDPKAKYFVKGYEGELTAEAIKAEATALGLVQASVDNAAQAEAERLARMGRASSTGGAPEPPATGMTALAAELDSHLGDLDIPDGMVVDAMDILKDYGGLPMSDVVQIFAKHGARWMFDQPVS